ncbi:MAG: hypothetical protein KGP27_02305 [Hyphomicrobiales bacterium]|nr:hypothetical protein [Hyphomicrobiales bacterium]
MPFAAYCLRLLGLSQAIHAWTGSLTRLNAERREKIARYADAIAATLARSAAAFSTLERDGGDTRALCEAIRELGRISGYVEDIVDALQDDLDGRKLAGVKRRLDRLAESEPLRVAVTRKDARRIDNLLEAEGYFRALADGLRT